MYGRRSPNTHAWPISGPAAFRRISMFAGDMFLPAALMISSFLRSTIQTKPSSSIARDVAGVQPAVPVDGLRGQVVAAAVAAP